MEQQDEQAKTIEEHLSKIKQLEKEKSKVQTLHDDLTMETREKAKQFDTLKEEFSTRLGKEENKTAALRRDKEQLKKEVQAKEKTISELNEQLAKETQEKESLKQLKEKFEAQIKEMEQKRVEDKLEQQNTQIDSYKKQIETLEGNLTQVKNENEQNKTTIASLRKEYSFELEVKINELNRKHEAELLELQQTIDQLRETVSNANSSADEKVETLKKDVELWMKKHRDLEDKSQEIMSLIPDATKPLLEQIQSLEQSTTTKANLSSEKEKKFQTKLQIAENNLKLTEQEVTRLTKLTERLKQNNQELEGDIQQMKEILNTERQKTEQERSKRVEIETSVSAIKTSLKRSQEDNHYLEQQINELHETIRKLNAELEKNSSNSNTNHHTVPYETTSSEHAASNQSTPQMTSDETEQATENETEMINLTNSELLEIIEKKNNKIKTLFVQIRDLEEIKEDLSERLAMYKQTNQTLANEINEKELTLKQFNDLKFRYEAALDLIGEKEEALQTIQEEFKYVKETFRTQISSLLKEIETLKT